MPTKPKRLRTISDTLQKKRRSKVFEALNQIDPQFMKRLEPFLDAVSKYYFRVETQGWDKIPENNVLFVGNHNGLITYEILMLFHAWHQKFGNTRKAVGLAHSMAFKNPLFSWMLPRIGAIPANPDFAQEAITRGFSILVYPGGTKEAFRPFKERKRVDFYQRKGFIRLALKTKTQIVPIISVGAHETFIILDRGEALAEALGVKKYLKLHGFPLTFRSIFAAWCLLTGLVTFFPLLLLPAAIGMAAVPMPAKMNFEFLDPIDPSKLLDPNKSEEDNLQAIYDHVLKIMQDAVKSAYEKRKLPILG